MDFGKIGGVLHKYFDTDYIDIKRDVAGTLREIYSNIPCHVAYSSVDNPDPTSVDTKPIIQSITIHLENYVDIQNNDFIIAKKIGSDGSLIATYSGRCGNPVVSQGRKKVLMQMSGTQAENPTPLPPKSPAIITVEYFCNDSAILDSEKQEAEIGIAFDLTAPVIEGYKVAECYIDGIKQESATAHIDSVNESGHTIRFVYAVSDIPEFFRFLVNGLYTKDSGSLAKGYHLYKKVDIDSVEIDGNEYTITSDDVDLTHSDNGKLLTVIEGAEMLLIPSNVFVSVNEIVKREKGKVTFTATAFEPTEKQKDAYICGWYD